MQILANRFLELRNDFIIPLVSYKIFNNRTDIDRCNLKDTICTKFHAAIIESNNKIILSFDNDELFRALIVDIELFYTQTFLQHINVIESSKKSSVNWCLTTRYYCDFFTATTLLRLLHKGYIFLDIDKISEFNSVLTSYTNRPINWKSGHYYFEIKYDETDQNYILELTTGHKNTHEDLWNKVSSMFLSILNIGPRDDEYVVLKIFTDILANNPKLPSQVRNKINYNPRYGLKALRKEIYSYETENLSLTELFNAIVRISTLDNIQMEINFCSLYGRYIFLMMNSLYKQYIDRSPITNRSLYEERRRYLRNKPESEEMNAIFF
jgi:hypothetical protein